MLNKKEVWKDIVGFEGLYQVSSFGRVKNLRRRGRILKDTNSYGYRQLTLAKNGVNRQFRVHRLVAEAFIPNQDSKKEINHIDGDKTNNHIENLEWCTRKENAIHSISVLGHKSKLEQIKPFQFKNGHRCWNSIKVKCVETGEVFDSIAEAGRSKGIARGSLGRIKYCCNKEKLNGKRINSVGGYRWEFI